MAEIKRDGRLSSTQVFNSIRSLRETAISCHGGGNFLNANSLKIKLGLVLGCCFCGRLEGGDVMKTGQWNERDGDLRCDSVPFRSGVVIRSCFDLSIQPVLILVPKWGIAN